MVRLIHNILDLQRDLKKDIETNDSLRKEYDALVVERAAADPDRAADIDVALATNREQVGRVTEVIADRERRARALISAREKASPPFSLLGPAYVHRALDRFQKTEDTESENRALRDLEQAMRKALAVKY